MLGLALHERAAIRIVHNQRADMLTLGALTHEWSVSERVERGADRQTLRVDFDPEESVVSYEDE